MTDNTFQNRLPLVPKDLAPFTPFPKYSDRAAWRAVANKTLYMSRGEKALTQGEFAPLSASEYIRFSKDGDRATFETKYFEKRRRITDLIMAECCEGKGRFIPCIVDGIWSMCDESAWQVPAHNAYERDVQQLILPDVTRPVLDLFACESGALLATAYYLFHDSIGEENQLLEKRMQHTLHQRIVVPYFEQYFWWMGNGNEPMNNWTSWCTQNVLLVMLLTPQTEQIRHKAITKAAYSLDCFLKDYGDDGCCNEGAQYYRHAGLALFGATDILEKVAPEAFESVFALPKIRNIAEYILNMNVHDDCYINFADCSPVAGRCSVREYLFGIAVKSDALIALAAQDCKANEQEEGDIARINLYYVLQEAFYLEAAQKCTLQKAMPQDIYYESVGVYVSRCNTYTLAVKAGCNADSHNHNDTGSVIIYKSNKPFLIDIGVESYCKKTFSPQRYEIWTMQSKWHNVATFDDAQQLDGKEYKAKNVATLINTDTNYIEMSLESAYSKEAQLTSYTRKVVHEKDNRIVITDSCKGKYKIATLTLMLLNKPVIDSNKVMVEGVGEIELDGYSAITTHEVAVTDQRLRKAWPDTLHYLQIKYSDKLITIIK